MKPVLENAVIDELESTNDYVRTLGEQGATHGTWISARRQKKGRGRLGREWISTEGNLFLSMVIRPSTSFPMTWIPLTVALAVHEVSQSLRPEMELVLKWPNDLGIRDRKQGFRKIGGILCEGVGSAKESFVVAGIGVNCAIAPETDQPTASLGVSVDTFREKLVERLREIFSQPIDWIRRKYSDASLFQEGDTIEWRDLRETQSEKIHLGAFERYGEFGELWVKDEKTNQTHRLFSEEVKLKLRDDRED